VLASRVFSGLILLQRVKMGRDRERIVSKRVAMVVEAGDGQNKPLFLGTSLTYTFLRNASAPFAGSLTN
jgi:hypothetical protein